MKHQLTVRKQEGVAVIDASGKIILGEGTRDLREGVRSLLADGRAHIVLNLQDVTYLDSSAIGELVAAHDRCEAAGGKLVLVNSLRVQELLAVSKLSMVFDIFQSVNGAIKSFDAQPTLQ